MGVDVLIDEEPVPWLDRGKPVPKADVPAARPQAAELPSTLVGLQQWLATADDIPGAGPDRLAWSGTPGAPLMILMDMPLVDDLAAGVLLSNEVGELFDKMLAALKADRSAAYVAALCPTRSPTGMLDEAHYPRLGEIARHHIALAAPNQVWLLGDAVSRAVLGTRLMDARGILHKINHEIGSVDAVVSFSPAFLHKNPRRKGDAWADMQLLLKGVQE